MTSHNNISDWFCHGLILHPGYFYNYDPDRTILDLHVLQDPERNRIAFNIVADCRSTTADEDVKHWTRLDTQIGKIDSEGLIHKLECVFGFNDREEMVRFATTVLATKMPSVSRLAVVRYSVHVSEQWFGKWYRASLDSEELTGMPFVSLHSVKANLLA